MRKENRLALKEYLTIKEFSKLSGIETTTLRYWDEIGLFSPTVRNPENHYRYYTPPQIMVVNFIKTLSRLDIPLKTIGETETQRTPERIMEIIEQQELLLDLEMHRIREAYSVIHTRRDLIKTGLRINAGEIVLENMREKRYILGPPAHYDTGELFYEQLITFCNCAEELRINLNYPIGGYFHSFEAFVKNPAQPTNFFSLDPTGNSKQLAGEYINAYYRGYYGQFGNLPEQMLAYAKEKELTPFGPVYVLYLHDELCIPELSNYLVRISVSTSPTTQLDKK